jgi:2-dehydropantoate 2-reductase
MRVAVMGTGGVGGYFGGRLAAAGHEVVFIARGAHLAALRSDGLRVESPVGDLHLPAVEATDDPAGIGPVDIVLLSVKLWDTIGAAEAIKPLVKGETGVVSLQNGVVKDDMLRRVLGAEAVIGGSSYVISHIAAPGVIRHTGTMAKLVFGEYGGVLSPRVRELRDACAAAGFDVEASDHIERELWEKFVLIVGMSGSTSLARLPIGPLREHARSRAFLRDVMDEVVRVGRAEGVPLPADFADDRLAFIDQMAPDSTSSMHRDLERGNRIEVAWLSGDVAERGDRLGMPTPRNRAIYDILSVHSAQ